MPASPQRCVAVLRDAKGNTARYTFYVDGSVSANAAATAMSNVLTALTPLTNAVLQSAIGPFVVVPQEVVYGTNASYASVEDKAIFTFQTATGSIHRPQVPAPKSAIFLADGETVDPANALVVTYVAAIIANTITRDGEVVAFGAFGTRLRRKMHRKLTIFVKNPALTGPGE